MNQINYLRPFDSSTMNRIISRAWRNIIPSNCIWSLGCSHLPWRSFPLSKLLLWCIHIRPWSVINSLLAPWFSSICKTWHSLQHSNIITTRTWILLSQLLSIFSFYWIIRPLLSYFCLCLVAAWSWRNRAHQFRPTWRSKTNFWNKNKISKFS